MTEQEAQTMATRLTKIWVGYRANDLQEKPLWKLEHVSNKGKWKGRNGLMRFIARLEDVVFEMNYVPDGYFFSLKREEEGVVTGELYCAANSSVILGDVLARPELKCQYEQFISQWLPFFRRGCWLSGCPIEATTHEKGEWLQDFTQEEIEAWNLLF